MQDSDKQALTNAIAMGYASMHGVSLDDALQMAQAVVSFFDGANTRQQRIIKQSFVPRTNEIIEQISDVMIKSNYNTATEFFAVGIALASEGIVNLSGTDEQIDSVIEDVVEVARRCFNTAKVARNNPIIQNLAKERIEEEKRQAAKKYMTIADLEEMDRKKRETQASEAP